MTYSTIFDEVDKPKEKEDVKQNKNNLCYGLCITQS